METIGIIGVGLLGSAIAARLSAAGYDVVGYDLVAEKRRTIFLCLPTSDVGAQVLEALQLKPGTVISDSTTGEPEAMAAFGEKLAKRSVDYLDATVLGSSR